MDTPNEPLRKLLRKLQADRLKLLERRSLLTNVARASAAPRDRFALDQLVDDYRAYVGKAEAAVSDLGASSEHLAVLFLSADAMLLRSLELVQAALEGETYNDYSAKVDEANAQQEIALKEMAELVFDIGFDPEEPQP